jgi:hypothetical protein
LRVRRLPNRSSFGGWRLGRAGKGGRSRLRAVLGEDGLPSSRRRSRVLGGVTAGAAVLSCWVG